MAATSPPIAETIETPRRRVPSRRALRRAAWVAADALATAGFALYALHALS